MSTIAAVLMVAGSAMSALAALGIWRFPDFYTRTHAASLAGPLGAGLILLAVAFASGDWSVSIRAVLGALLILATGPVSSHLLARAALRAASPPPILSFNNDEYDASR